MIRNRMRWLASLLVAVLGLLLVAPSTAFAHAILESSDPTAGAELATAPTTITLTFSENVEISLGALRLFDGSGRSVDVGAAEHPGGHGSEVRVQLPALANGSYVVDWRVVSSDSHPIQGAYTFQVGPVSNLQPGVLDGITGDDHTGRAAGIALGVSRATIVAAIAVVFGGLAALAAGIVPVGRRIRRLVVIAAVVGGAVGVLQLPFEVGYATGRSLSIVLDGDAWSAAFESSVGVAWFVRAIVLAGVGIGLILTMAHRARWWWRGLGVAGLVGVALASAFSGHGDTGRWHLVGVAATVVHVSGMAVWLGGLVALVVCFGDVDGTAVRRFSTLALSMVGLVVASGIVQSIRQVGSFSALTGTTYGTVLIWKVVFVALALGVAGLNRRLVRADDLDRPRLRRAVGVEVLITIAIVVSTSLLMSANPSEAVTSKPFSVTLLDEGYLASITIEPGRVGANEMHLYLSSADSSLIEPDDVLVQISDPSRDVAAIDIPVTRSGPAHFTTPQATFPYAATWVLTVSARYGTFDQVTFTSKVTIR